MPLKIYFPLEILPSKNFPPKGDCLCRDKRDNELFFHRNIYAATLKIATGIPPFFIS